MPVQRSASLGSSGLQVSRLALGTMMFGEWGNPDEAECRRMVDMALDAGITLFDTADIYDYGRSEQILGDALAGRRDAVVLATKVGNPMSDDPAERGLSARWVRQACENSLRRLGTDHIDLYQLHRPDPSVPIAETLGEMAALQREGKIGAVGTSTFAAAQIAEAHDAAMSVGLPVLASEQPPYSVLVRGIEREVLPTCEARGVGVICWAPLNGGWLTGKYQSSVSDAQSRAHRKPEHFDHRDEAMRTMKHDLVESLSAVAQRHDLTLVELALAFVLAHPAVTSAIVGPRTPAQLHQLLAARPVDLPAEALDAIDAIVTPAHTVNPADDG